jgi:Rad3-related DNA helicase
MDYIEVSSPYPVENRYIHYRPIIAMSYRNKHEHYKIINEVEVEVDKRKNVKGLIHTISYRLNNKIMDIGNDRFITHDTDDKDEMFKIFRESEGPVIWVSPSSERGLDLFDDLCRFIIWPKVPFSNLGDKCISARCHSGRFGSRWFMAMAAQAIMQGCGRGNRHDKDFCEAIILDEKFEDLMEYLAEWFRKAIIIE